MALEINFQSVKLEAESLPHLSTENQQIKNWICAPSSTFLLLDHLRPTVVCLGEFFSGNNCWCIYNGKMWASLRELYLMEEQKNREQFHTPSFFDLIGSSQITNYYCYVSAQGLKKAFAVQDYIREASAVTGERHYLSWLSVRVRKWLLRRTFSVAVGAVCTAHVSTEHSGAGPTRRLMNGGTRLRAGPRSRELALSAQLSPWFWTRAGLGLMSQQPLASEGCRLNQS